MRVAAVQMTSTPDKGANLSEAHRLLMEALDKRAEFVAFPENFTLLTNDRKQLYREAETTQGLTTQTLQEWAAEYDVWILAGSLPIRAAGDAKRVMNTSLLISPEGSIKARYDKIHLFDVNLSKDKKYEESKSIRPGKKPVIAKAPWGKLGMSICYDLRFPELYRKLSEQGAQVLFIPSAFTALTGKAHWDALTRARAIENLSYVVAPAQTGSPYPGRLTHGHTRIIDPWGRILAERPAGPGVAWADLNFQELERIRRELPALKHRRLK